MQLVVLSLVGVEAHGHAAALERRRAAIRLMSSMQGTGRRD
jgi:hypothetical protein